MEKNNEKKKEKRVFKCTLYDGWYDEINTIVENLCQSINENKNTAGWGWAVSSLD